MPHCPRQGATGEWFSAVGCWLSAVGCWAVGLLAVGAAGTAAPWPCVVRPSPALCKRAAPWRTVGVCRGNRAGCLGNAQVKQGRTEGATRLERLIAPCVPIFYSQTGIFWGLCGAFWCLLVSAGAGAGLVVQFAGLWGHHPDALLFPPLICPTPQAPQHPHSTA